MSLLTQKIRNVNEESPKKEFSLWQKIRNLANTNPVQSFSDKLHEKTGIKSVFQHAKEDPEKFKKGRSLQEVKDQSIFLKGIKGAGQNFKEEFLDPTLRGIDYLKEHTGGKQIREGMMKQGLTEEQANKAMDITTGLIGSVGRITPKVIKNVTDRLKRLSSKEFTKNGKLDIDLFEDYQTVIERLKTNPDSHEDIMEGIKILNKIEPRFKAKSISPTTKDTFKKDYLKFKNK